MGLHKKCTGIKDSMTKVAKSFICRGCLNPVTSARRASVDIGASAKLELVDKFCYLGDTWFLGPTWLNILDNISIGLAVFAGLIAVSNRHRDHATAAAISHILVLRMR